MFDAVTGTCVAAIATTRLFVYDDVGKCWLKGSGSCYKDGFYGQYSSCSI